MSPDTVAAPAGTTRPMAEPCCDHPPCWQTLQKELAGHAPRLAEVLSRGEVAASGDEPSLELEARVQELQGLWETLRAEAAARHRRLQEAGEAQQYYLDAGEAEAWVSEQELFMGAEEKPKVRGGSTWCPCVLEGGGGGLCAVPCGASLCQPRPCHAVPLNIIRYHAVSCRYMPSHAVLCHDVPSIPCSAVPMACHPSRSMPSCTISSHAVIGHPMPCHAVL